jgi:hypothetical protein
MVERMREKTRPRLHGLRLPLAGEGTLRSPAYWNSGLRRRRPSSPRFAIKEEAPALASPSPREAVGRVRVGGG